MPVSNPEVTRLRRSLAGGLIDALGLPGTEADAGALDFPVAAAVGGPSHDNGAAALGLANT